MKLLVTGGAGFIGSAVVRLAIARGHRVVNLDALTYAANLHNLASVEGNPGYAFEKADIRDRAALDRILTRHRPDAVMHLAAESHVDRSIDGPAAFVQTNILGSFHHARGRARAIGMRQGRPDGIPVPPRLDRRGFRQSLDPRVGSPKPPPMTRAAPIRPARQPRTIWCAPGHETYGLPVVLTNCSNNYGPYHFPEKLVPVVILNALAGRPIPVYGDGGNIRDWLYVEDHADALLTVLDKGRVGRSYNIGGENEARNIDLVRMICAHMDELRPGAAPACRSDHLCAPTDPAMTGAMPSTPPACGPNWTGGLPSRWKKGCAEPSNGILQNETGGGRC